MAIITSTMSMTNTMRSTMATLTTKTTTIRESITLNPKGKLEAKVRVLRAGRNPFALQAVWMKAGGIDVFTCYLKRLCFVIIYL